MGMYDDLLLFPKLSAGPPSLLWWTKIYGYTVFGFVFGFFLFFNIPIFLWRTLQQWAVRLTTCRMCVWAQYFCSSLHCNNRRATISATRALAGSTLLSPNACAQSTVVEQNEEKAKIFKALWHERGSCKSALGESKMEGCIRKKPSIPANTDQQAFIYAAARSGLWPRQSSGRKQQRHLILSTHCDDRSANTFCSPGLMALSRMHVRVYPFTHPHTEHICLHPVTN